MRPSRLAQSGSVGAVVPSELVFLHGRGWALGSRGARSRLGHASRIGAVALLLTFVALKISWFWHERPVYTGDHRIWAKIGENSLASRSFWASTRPFVLPLVNKLLGFSDERVIWFQCLLGALSWALFAVAVAGLARSFAARALALVLLLGFALTSSVHGWDAVIRSESLSLSFLALTCAATLGYATGRSRSVASKRPLLWLVAAVLSALFAAFSRDTNAFLLLAAAPFLLLPPLPRSQRVVVELGVLAACFLAIALFSNANVQAGKRYRVPLMNIIFRRVLPDRHDRKYFERELAMPVNAALLSRRRKWASSDRWFAGRSPDLAAFRAWLVERGYTGYQRYLVTHPTRTLQKAYAHFPRFASERFRGFARRPTLSTSKELNDWATKTVMADYPLSACIALSAFGAAGAVILRRRHRALGALVVYLALASVSQVYVCFHGDAMELGRHGLLVGVLLRLAATSGAVLLVNVLVDVLFVAHPLSRRGRAGHAEAAPNLDAREQSLASSDPGHSNLRSG